MLEGGRRGQAGRLFQLADKLPAVERVQQVDIARPAVEHADGQFALLHKHARGLLVRVAAVFKFHFLHNDKACPFQRPVLFRIGAEAVDDNGSFVLICF